jgi:hypothetical protein
MPKAVIRFVDVLCLLAGRFAVPLFMVEAIGAHAFDVRGRITLEDRFDDVPANTGGS